MIPICHTQCRTKGLLLFYAYVKVQCYVFFIINDECAVLLNFDHPVYLLFLEEWAFFNILTTLRLPLENIVYVHYFRQPFFWTLYGKVLVNFCGVNEIWKWWQRIISFRKVEHPEYSLWKVGFVRRKKLKGDDGMLVCNSSKEMKEHYIHVFVAWITEENSLKLGNSRRAHIEDDFCNKSFRILWKNSVICVSGFATSLWTPSESQVHPLCEQGNV